ncbi:PTS sugar transporter subunit IIA [Streptococcus tangpeifui]|uniref:PTS sugar transporter subunit IIA n=1 Tax=Streptococcus tangpeifui TaxID=2709400 RepID=UPI0013EA6FC1|nr:MULTISPECIES: fructose PTS transporter subunit IIA [unclassified Streptococcus]
MEVTDVIDKNLVLTDLTARSKDEILRKLCQLLEEQAYLEDADSFLEDVYLREKEGQTGIGNFVAIPHGKSEAVNKIGVAIAINKYEIPWESLDGKGVKVVILFAVGNDTDNAQEHLKLLALFAKKLGKDRVVENLLAAQSVEDVVAAFA